jgi:hypothetical protein
MSPHEWFVEHRGGFVARALDPADHEAFADHLTRCPECQGAVRQIERELDWLPMGTRPVSPRPGLRWRIAQAVLGRPERPAWHVGVPLGLAATALLVAGASWVRAREREASLRLDLAVASARVAALVDSLSVMQQAARVLQASIETEGRSGGLLIFADSVSHRWSVIVHGLPPAPPGEKYQFWFICSDGMVKGAELVPVPGRPLFVTLGMPDRGGAVLGASLSREPVGNRSDQPRGKQLAHLML